MSGNKHDNGECMTCFGGPESRTDKAIPAIDWERLRRIAGVMANTLCDFIALNEVDDEAQDPKSGIWDAIHIGREVLEEWNKWVASTPVERVTSEATKRECGHARGSWRCVARPGHDGGHDMKPVYDPIDAPLGSGSAHRAHDEFRREAVEADAERQVRRLTGAGPYRSPERVSAEAPKSPAVINLGDAFKADEARHRAKTAGNVIHYASTPFVALCGADENGQHTTDARAFASCPACLEKLKTKAGWDATGPRGVAGKVTVVDVSGDGSGPWRLFVGEYGVADWPCCASDTPEGQSLYASEVARCIRDALADEERGPVRRRERATGRPKVIGLLGDVVAAARELLEHGSVDEECHYAGRLETALAAYDAALLGKEGT